MLTGFLDYNNLEYFFVVDEKVNQLKLISTKKHIPFSTDILRMEEPFLIGTINEERKKIVFITKQNAIISRNNDSLYIELSAYFLLNLDEPDSIDKIDFYSPEIDRIYNINRAVDFSNADSLEARETGAFSINIKDFKSTTTEKQKFTVAKKDIYVTFQIERFVSKKIDKPTLSLQSYLSFVFEATTDYIFIINLCNYAINFIRYLCFRKNIYFTSIQVFTPKENKHNNIGELYIYDNNHEPEQEPLEQNRCIKYEYIMGHEGKILSDIVSNFVYLRHFPTTFANSQHLKNADFIMIVTAFEWEFSRNYSKKLLKKESLKVRISNACKDYSEIIKVFGNRLYNLNKIEFNYDEIGERIATQRNNLAHGNLYEDVIKESSLDIFFLECIVYAMQLKKFGLSNENIKKSINDVFNLEIPLSVLLNTTK